MNTVIRARIDERVKEEAAAVLEAIGLTVSDAFRLLMVRTATEKRLPFEPLVPNEETVATMLAARRRESVDVDGAEPVVGESNAVGERNDGRLRDALIDLDEVVTDAVEEGFPRPTDDAIQNARRLLIQSYAIAPQRFEVYPTADGEIALDLPNDRGSVILLCDSRGGALCLVNVNGVRRRARYSSTTKLPDGFVREALTELASY
ncbi:MAG: type II toxin-antitoxin system RelB/DinJ family antitoxin [Spirochaetaceae bacterium]|nr:type II toxin-antitoxin system RelB/DinJ family antitoxin [Spirochaetaceae bacterium]